MGELTSDNTTPYLITVSKALSVDLFISGEYSFSNPSSVWSKERRDPAYVNIISSLQGGWEMTNYGICGKLHFQRPAVLSNDNNFCHSLLDMNERVSDHEC